MTLRKDKSEVTELALQLIAEKPERDGKGDSLDSLLRRLNETMGALEGWIEVIKTAEARLLCGCANAAIRLN